MWKRRGRGGRWGPSRLFATGEVGVWFDPSDISTLFQDTAGTTPITTDGQTVALMRDKSGNDLHATQATAARRPTYRTSGGYPELEFDGVDDCLVTASITAGADKALLLVGQKKTADAAAGQIAELSANWNLNAGTLVLSALATDAYQANSRGTVSSGNALSAARPAPDTAVLTVLGDIAGDSNILRVNGAQVAQSTTDQGTGNYGSHVLNIGRRNQTSLPYTGRLRGMILRFGSSQASVDQIAAAEAWMNTRTGAY